MSNRGKHKQRKFSLESILNKHKNVYAYNATKKCISPFEAGNISSSIVARIKYLGLNDRVDAIDYRQNRKVRTDPRVIDLERKVNSIFHNSKPLKNEKTSFTDLKKVRKDSYEPHVKSSQPNQVLQATIIPLINKKMTGTADKESFHKDYYIKSTQGTDTEFYLLACNKNIDFLNEFTTTRQKTTSELSPLQVVFKKERNILFSKTNETNNVKPKETILSTHKKALRKNINDQKALNMSVKKFKNASTSNPCANLCSKLMLCESSSGGNGTWDTDKQIKRFIVQQGMNVCSARAAKYNNNSQYNRTGDLWSNNQVKNSVVPLKSDKGISAVLRKNGKTLGKVKSSICMECHYSNDTLITNKISPKLDFSNRNAIPLKVSRSYVCAKTSEVVVKMFVYAEPNNDIKSIMKESKATETTESLSKINRSKLHVKKAFKEIFVNKAIARSNFPNSYSDNLLSNPDSISAVSSETSEEINQTVPSINESGLSFGGSLITGIYNPLNIVNVINERNKVKNVKEIRDHQLETPQGSKDTKSFDHAELSEASSNSVTGQVLYKFNMTIKTNQQRKQKQKLDHNVKICKDYKS